MSVPSKRSVPVNSNDFEALIDQWLDYESDVDIDNSDIVIESEHDTNSEIAIQIQRMVIQKRQLIDKLVNFTMEKIDINGHKNHFIVVILKPYNTIS